jgi:hypothetical protein
MESETEKSKEKESILNRKKGMKRGKEGRE